MGVISWVFFIIHLLFAFLIIFLMLAFFIGAPFIPTPKKKVEEMLKLADIKKGDIVVDLGSGDGRLLIASAKKGVKAVGWEINPFLVLLSKLIVNRAGVADAVTIHWGDYRRVNLKNFTVVFLFAITNRMAAIEAKLRQELKPGSRVISYTFPFPTKKESLKTASGIYHYRF